MATQASFDITSNVDLQEVDNALNQARKEVAQRYDFKGSKASIEFDPKESKLVLVSDLDAGELIVVDAPGRKELKRLKLGASPEGILIPPSGGRAYVAVNGDNYVSVIDLKTLAETGRIPTGRGPDGMAWAERK